MNSKIPVISVVIPVYNAQNYVDAAIQSILAQSFTDFELVIVDDGSTDGSLKIIHAISGRDSRVRVLSRPNTGIVGSRLNRGCSPRERQIYCPNGCG